VAAFDAMLVIAHEEGGELVVRRWRPPRFAPSGAIRLRSPEAFPLADIQLRRGLIWLLSRTGAALALDADTGLPRAWAGAEASARGAACAAHVVGDEVWLHARPASGGPALHAQTAAAAAGELGVRDPFGSGERRVLGRFEQVMPVVGAPTPAVVAISPAPRRLSLLESGGIERSAVRLPPGVDLRFAAANPGGGVVLAGSGAPAEDAPLVFFVDKGRGALPFEVLPGVRAGGVRAVLPARAARAIAVDGVTLDGAPFVLFFRPSPLGFERMARVEVPRDAVVLDDPASGAIFAVRVHGDEVDVRALEGGVALSPSPLERAMPR
jgi:hypothetical protein